MDRKARRVSSSDACFPLAVIDFVRSRSSHPLPAALRGMFIDSPVDTTFPQDIIMGSEHLQCSSRTESPPAESSNGTPEYPLDEYLEPWDDTSDEEMETNTPGDSSTPPPASQSEGVRCLWKGCSTELVVGTHYDVWKDHIKSAHGNQGRGRLSSVTTCQWGECGKKLRKSQGILEHTMARHLRDIRSPCPLGCEKSLPTDGLALARHLRCCSLRKK